MMDTQTRLPDYSVYQCQLLTLVASGLSSTIHLGSPSPHLAILNKSILTAHK